MAREVEETRQMKGLRDIEQKCKEWWTLTAENKALRETLSCALDEHDGNDGELHPDYMPQHWTHTARRLLKSKEAS